MSSPGGGVRAGSRRRRKRLVPLVGAVAIALVPGFGSASATSAKTTPATRPTAAVVLTTPDLRRALSRRPDVTFSTARIRGVPVIHVNDAVHYQRISGFGAAMTDSAAWLLYGELPAQTRDRVMNALFSVSGIHLTLVRVPIAASDFTVHERPYSYDDLARGQSDPQLRHFSVAHDFAYVLPALRLMRRIDPAVQILANPWSPPAWMKANQLAGNAGFAGTLLAADYQPLAEYFVKFLQAYAAAGVPVNAITPQNEPRAPAQYPGMSFPPSDVGRWIVDNLLPALRASGLQPQIYGLDDTELADAQALLAGPAGTRLSGIAWHCYQGLDQMSTLHREHPSVNEIVSECSPGIIPYAPVDALIDATRNWASGVALWNLALDPNGGPVQPPDSGCRYCSGLVKVSESRHRSSFNLGYYQVGQVSRYVQPGAVRIGSERLVSDFHGPNPRDRRPFGVSAGIDDVAFLNPNGTKVLVVYNNSAASGRFAVSFHGRGFEYTLAARATVTFTWK
jgi:glucosylceramidase